MLWKPNFVLSITVKFLWASWTFFHSIFFFFFFTIVIEWNVKTFFNGYVTPRHPHPKLFFSSYSIEQIVIVVHLVLMASLCINPFTSALCTVGSCRCWACRIQVILFKQLWLFNCFVSLKNSLSFWRIFIHICTMLFLVTTETKIVAYTSEIPTSSENILWVTIQITV